MFSASASNGLAQRSSVDWPMFRHDSAHSGVGTGSPVLAPTLLWKYTTGGPVDSSPAVVNGVVYVGCYDGSLYALNSATGAKIWIEGASGDPLISSPAVVGGSVYVGGAGEIIAKTTESGVQVMGATSTASLYGSLVDSSPAVVDGIVIVTAVPALG